VKANSGKVGKIFKLRRDISKISRHYR